MKRIDYLITEIRRLSNNENYSSTEGIADEQIIRYLNDAQDYLQSAISNTNQNNKVFSVEKIISVVAGQEAYTIPGRVFYNKEIQLVEFSYDGTTQSYAPLIKLQLFNRDTYQRDVASGYYVRNGQINLVPVPTTSTGSIRVLFEGKLDQLDKRRGTVSVVSGLTSTTFTSITIGSDADEASVPNLSTIDYVCINDAFGNVKAYNIPVSNYNTGTNVLTPGTFTFQAGETIAVNDFVTFGKYSTTHSKLMDEAEAFLIHYAVEQCMADDAHEDVIKQSSYLQRLLEGILAATKSQTPEITYIPQVDWSEWWG